MRIVYLLLLNSLFSIAQIDYPKDNFRLPLDIPMQLSGNFGELRPNHFHAGFDFKTNQQEGLNVYAVADGYISRIKISNSGYGKALYITHKNGFTTVYGHLQKAVGIIQEKIVSIQYSEKSYEIEAFFKPDEILIKQGEIIAISGNTGGSEGPHLHFEIRENKTEKIVNPLFFGLDLKDTKPPIISSLMVYPVDKNSVVKQSHRPIAVNLSLQNDGTYLAEKISASGKIGFGISTSDFDDVSYNQNGTYKTVLFSNGKPIFKYEFDKMIFDEARYVNAFIDYERYKKSHQRVQKLFMKIPYNWSNIKENVNNGVLDIIPNFNGVQKIEVSDFFENITSISIPISYSPDVALVPEITKTTKYLIKANADANFEKDNFSAFFPSGTFYDDFYMNFNVKDDTLQLHDDTVPAHSNFTITIIDPKYSENERKKIFIASVYGSKLNYNSTKIVGSTFSCKSKTLGQFKLVQDTVAPKVVISKSIENKWITDKKSIVLKIFDDLSGIKSYNGYINDKWVLFEYESKLNRLTHIFDDNLLLEGSNKLKLIVIDNVGNSTIFETKFNRSQKK